MAKPKKAKNNYPILNRNLKVTKFDSLSDDLANFDNAISPVERNISWFINSAKFSLVAKGIDGKIKGNLSLKNL